MRTLLIVLCFAAGHNGQSGIDGSLFTATDGSIDHRHATGREFLRNFLRNDRIDRAHINEELSVFCAFFDSVRPKRNQFHIG